MTELWADLTTAQALLIVLAAWVLMRAADAVTVLARRLLGMPSPYTDPCEHGEDFDLLAERVDRLCDCVSDQLVELERIRQATEESADRESAGAL